MLFTASTKFASNKVDKCLIASASIEIVRFAISRIVLELLNVILNYMFCFKKDVLSLRIQNYINLFLCDAVN